MSKGKEKRWIYECPKCKYEYVSPLELTGGSHKCKPNIDRYYDWKLVEIDEDWTGKRRLGTPEQHA